MSLSWSWRFRLLKRVVLLQNFITTAFHFCLIFSKALIWDLPHEPFLKWPSVMRLKSRISQSISAQDKTKSWEMVSNRKDYWFGGGLGSNVKAAEATAMLLFKRKKKLWLDFTVSIFKDGTHSPLFTFLLFWENMLGSFLTLQNKMRRHSNFPTSSIASKPALVSLDFGKVASAFVLAFERC